MKQLLEQFERITQQRDAEVSDIETQIKALQDRHAAIKETYSQKLAALAGRLDEQLGDCQTIDLIDAPKAPGSYLYRENGAPWILATVHADGMVSFGLSSGRFGPSYVDGGEWAAVPTAELQSDLSPAAH